MVIRENPDLTAFLTLDLKIWRDTKCLREKLAPIQTDTNVNEIYVIIARVLLGKQTSLGDPNRLADQPFWARDARGEPVLIIK